MTVPARRPEDDALDRLRRFIDSGPWYGNSGETASWKRWSDEARGNLATVREALERHREEADQRATLASHWEQKCMTLAKNLDAATPDWSKCNCGAGPYGIHARWCALALTRFDQLGKEQR